MGTHLLIHNNDTIFSTWWSMSGGLSLASHIESPEEQLGPFFFKKRRDGCDFKELCFRSSSIPDQSLAVRASYKPFLGSWLVYCQWKVGHWSILLRLPYISIYVSILGDIKEQPSFPLYARSTYRKYAALWDVESNSFQMFVNQDKNKYC